MKMFIITKGERSQQTHETFRSWNPTFVTHDNRRAERIHDTTGSDRIIVSGVEPGPRGKIDQEMKVLREYVQPDEWVVIADDNIRRIQGVRNDQRAEWSAMPSGTERNRMLAQVRTAEEWRGTARLAIERAERTGARMIGCASTSNPLSRQRAWGSCSFVWGKLTIWKADPDYQWDDAIEVIEDWGHTAAHLLQYGAVVVDYLTYMDAKRYAPGGLGSLEERTRDREHDIAHLLQKYPGLFRDLTKPSGEHDLRMIRTRKTFPAWRQRYIENATGERRSVARGLSTNDG